MYYMYWSRKHVSSLNPIWERLLESDDPNPGIDKNVIVSEESHDDTTNLENETFVHPPTRYPRLDRLTEEHF